MYKFFKTDKEKLLNLISDFHFNKLYAIEEEVENIIKELELEKLKGRDFGEEGHFISGGEKQKIALARFILKKDYDFFIIDEPFSSLDAINEEKLLKLLSKYTEQKPGIIISHKLNVLNAIANKIIVIDKGKIVQKGTHKQLLNQDGIYKELISKFKNNKEF